MSVRKILVVFCSLFVMLATVSAVSSEILGNYVGYSACEPCHSDKVAGWKTTAHAEAFEILKIQGEEKQQNPGCVQCHVVGYDREGGFIDMELTPELKDVQCESCHGPGRQHAETLNPEAILGKPGEEVCRTCHTESQDKAFDFKNKSRMVHGKQ
jgi:hypothetical protein